MTGGVVIVGTTTGAGCGAGPIGISGLVGVETGAGGIAALAGIDGLGGGLSRGGSVDVGGEISNFVTMGSAGGTVGWTVAPFDDGIAGPGAATTTGPGLRVVGIDAYEGGSAPAGVRSGFITGTGNAPGVAPVTEYQFADAFGY